MTRKGLALAALLGACLLPQAPSAQTVPGPASAGWYVIMGEVRKGEPLLPGPGGMALDAIAEKKLRMMGRLCVGGAALPLMPISRNFGTSPCTWS